MQPGTRVACDTGSCSSHAFLELYRHKLTIMKDESCARRMIFTKALSMDIVDEQILEILSANARTPVSEIARQVNLSAAPVSRRIDRLERDGIIKGYVAIVDPKHAGQLEAFTEIRLNGATDTAELSDIVRDVPEIQQFFTIAGDPDAVVRIRVSDVDHLQRVVNAMRRSGKITGTKTLIVMNSWDRNHLPHRTSPQPT